MSYQVNSSLSNPDLAIRLNSALPPVEIPSGHIGPVVLPGSGRLIWWTGRVAIGLRYEPRHTAQTTGESASWLQDLLLRH